MTNPGIFRDFSDVGGIAARAAAAQADATQGIADAAAAQADATQGIADAAAALVVAQAAAATAAGSQVQLGTRTFASMTPNTGSTPQYGGYGTALISVTGTSAAATTPTPTTTNFLTRKQRLQMLGGTTVNSVAYAGVQVLAWNRNEGFRLVFVVGTSTTTTSQRSFWGMQSTNTTSATSTFNPGTTEPSSQVNCIGVGYDHAGTVLTVMHNDGTGSCTVVSLGASFPVDTISIYTIEIWAVAGDTVVNYRVTRANDGTVVSGQLSTNLPAVDTYMSPVAWTSNGGTAGTGASMALCGMYIQTPS